MDLLAAWLLYPLALGAISLGLGLLVERLAAWRMPGVLLLGVGLAALLALARLITFTSQTAPLALPVILVLALAGLVLGQARLRRLRPDPWIAAAALGVFVVFAAPIVLSGEPSFAGYLALPDTAHQLTLASLYPQHGPDYGALPNSSYRLSALVYTITHYPVSAQAAVGVTAPLGVLDLAWLYQPFLTFMAAVLSLAIAALAAPLFAHRWQAAVVAFVAAQSALVLGFALQGSIKELATVTMLVTAAAITAVAIAARRPARSLLALAPVVAAAVGALGPAALPYLALLALAVAVLWGTRIARTRTRRRNELAWLAVTGVCAAVLSIPILDSIREAITINTTTLDAVSGMRPGDAGAALGNLARPLELKQALGIWLSGDFRYRGFEYHTLQDALLIVAAAAALLGLSWALRRRAWGPLLLVAIIVPTSIYLLDRGNPYADAKVLMIVSPVLLMLAMLGAQSMWTGRWRAVSLAVTGVLALGALGSSAYAYRDVSLAPHDRFDELLALNDRLAGKGPVLVTEYDEFSKYLLRDATPYAQPEYPHGYRIDPLSKQLTLLDPKHRPSLKTPLDLDDLTLKYLESVPYVIVRRSPVASRPPSNFRLVKRGTYYDLWQRGPRPRVLRHRPLGLDILHPGATVDRVDALAWARLARRLDGRIAYSPRGPASIVLPTQVEHKWWPAYQLYPGAVVTAVPSRVAGPVRVDHSGRYQLWLEGSFGRTLDIAVDGRRVAQTVEGLNNPGSYERLATVHLTRGEHRIVVWQGVGDRTQPGNAGYRSSLRHIGPIVLAPVADERGLVIELEPRDWRKLVGRQSDWLEVVRS